MDSRLKKKILSISGIITNSSTQVYSIDITDEFLRLVEDNGLGDEVLVIKDRFDILKILEIPEYDYPNSWKITALGEALTDSCPNLRGLVDSYDLRGDLWKSLTDSGKTDLEIFEFFEPLFKDVYGKAYYSYEDDCGYPETARILDNNGYLSTRQ